MYTEIGMPPKAVIFSTLNGIGSVLKESSSFLVNCFSLDERLAPLTNADKGLSRCRLLMKS